MTKIRSNEEWLKDLNSTGDTQAEAISELRDLSFRASLFTFNHHRLDTDGLSQTLLEQMAEDCAQDALMAVLTHLTDFRGDSKFTTWVYKFAINNSLMVLRRDRWKSVSLDEQNDGFAMDYHKPNDPDLSAILSELVEAIQEAISSELSEKQRQVLKLIVFEEVPLDVVVERLGTNRNAIYKLMHDARKKLKHRLQEKGFGVEETLELFSTRK